jgi:hypothetical protein
MSKEIQNDPDILSVSRPWLVVITVLSICALTVITLAHSNDPNTSQGAARESYPKVRRFNTLTPKWSTKLVGFDVLTRD